MSFFSYAQVPGAYKPRSQALQKKLQRPRPSPGAQMYAALEKIAKPGGELGQLPNTLPLRRSGRLVQAPKGFRKEDEVAM